MISLFPILNPVFQASYGEELKKSILAIVLQGIPCTLNESASVDLLEISLLISLL